MAGSTSAKKQIVDSIKEATNILVTVSNSPSVDELSAALGLTIFLNELDKHATAVFSGDIPPAITFLEPDKTFEQNADSLRDFIIALDKEKADHLRYKVVDNAVKIFITPYRTTITEDDLEFSQGDYNVDLVLALNVQSPEHLDEALSAHGRILHGATVATVTAGQVNSNLGSIGWHDSSASGVSEMLVELIDGLKTPKVVMTEQIATALLTGIVSVTNRFGNEVTSSKAMSAAAELIASGANPQLIASKLEDVDELADEPKQTGAPKSVKLTEGESAKLSKKHQDDDDDGSLSIRHQGKRDLDEVARQTREDEQAKAAREASGLLDDFEPEPESEPILELAPEPEPEPELAPEPIAQPIGESKSPTVQEAPPQLIGGTLNATTAQAAEDKRRELADERNRTILTHGGYVGDQQRLMTDTPLNASMAPQERPDNFNLLMSPQETPSYPTTPAEQINLGGPIAPLGAVPTELAPSVELTEAASLATPAENVDSTNQTLISALTADTEALTTNGNNMVYSASPDMNQTPFAEPPAPQLGGNFIATPLASQPTVGELQPQQPQDQSSSEALLPMPGLEMPNFGTLPPLPQAPDGFDANQQIPAQPLDSQQPPAQAEFNPTAFQIPGQQ